MAGGPSSLLTSSFPPFGRSGRVTHADVSMMHVSMMFVFKVNVSVMLISMMHVSMMFVFMVNVSVMLISMMHMSAIHVSMMQVPMMHVCMIFVHMVHICIMHECTMHECMMHVCMMNVSSIHVSMMPVRMMHLSMTQDPEAHVYDAQMCDACIYGSNFSRWIFFQIVVTFFQLQRLFKGKFCIASPASSSLFWSNMSGAV